ncbi:hypothetical protein ABIG06_003405 [Bradyrhizobium sp. USDA 326]|uniref:Uncharacterized protein n=1 Tax=Bradyrhizobium yuanmingense TaxID=108015 RepID=A0A1C3XKQ8_9BRAD|nr:hypothetical protein IQ15_07521 [Bradyrhizobium yuanmingense]SCB52848.1 hypothetical protein GA0061099_104117 [Bradyrhizobium yuanmingense]
MMVVRQRVLSQVRMRRKLWPTAERVIVGAAGAAFEVTAAEVTIGLQLSYDGFDGGGAAQLAFDDAEDPVLLAGDEGATRVHRNIRCTGVPPSPRHSTSEALKECSCSRAGAAAARESAWPFQAEG